MTVLRVFAMLALAWALSEPGLVAAQVTDHFKCYPILRGNPANEFVELEDQFDKQVNIREQVLVGYPRLFCNPVEKTLATGAVTPIKNPNNHLKFYSLTPPAGQLVAIPGQPPALTRVVEIQNQFGPQRLLVTNPMLLAVPNQKRPHDPPQGLDHFKCYPARQDPALNVGVLLKDQFDTQPLPVRLGRAVLFCNPTAKGHDDQVIVPQNPEDHLTCYVFVANTAAPAANPDVTRVAQVRDQFMKDRLVLRSPRYLCVPTQKLNHIP